MKLKGKSSKQGENEEEDDTSKTGPVAKILKPVPSLPGVKEVVRAASNVKTTVKSTVDKTVAKAKGKKDTTKEVDPDHTSESTKKNESGEVVSIPEGDENMDQINDQINDSIKEEASGENSATKFAAVKQKMMDLSSENQLKISIVLAMLPTLFYLTRLAHNEIPIQVFLPWILVAFCFGKQQRELSQKDELLPISERSELSQERSVYFGASLPPAAETAPRQPTSWSNMVKGKVSRGISKMKRVGTKVTRVGRRGGSRSMAVEDMLSSSSLMKLLMQNPMYRKKKVMGSDIPASPAPKEGTLATDEMKPASTAIGALGAESSSADSLIREVVDPLFTLRGMDVFLTEDADGEASTHPFLINNGLRDVPTFIINMLTQWGNCFIYFEMPAWVESWETIEETPDDPDDVKALKRFFNGTDEYRNLRAKCLPSVVEAPLPIRMAAPAKKELVVHSAMLPCTWKRHGPETKDGRKLCPTMEVTLDLMSNSTMRGMASLVKRYLHAISIDAAFVLSKPLETSEPEPEACLGLWRFNHIRVADSPELPDRFAASKSPDVSRASQLLNISESDILEITAAASG